jgi:hypothetical protein
MIAQEDNLNATFFADGMWRQYHVTLLESEVTRVKQQCTDSVAMIFKHINLEP